MSERAILRLIVRGYLAGFRHPPTVSRAELAAYVERCRVRPGDLAPSLNQYRRAGSS